MATIVTRTETQTDGTAAKGSELTWSEVDTNFINLNDDKVEVSGAIVFAAKAGEALTKGDVVYVSGVSGNEAVVSKADADDAAKMPAFGLAEADANLNAAVNVATFGTLYDLDTSAFSAGDTVYVSTTAGGLTATKPAGEASLIQNIGKVIRSHASAGSIKVGGAGRSNDTPNLNDGNVFIGNASNQAEARALVEADISDFGSYLTSVSVDGLSDTTITSVADNEVLAYDSTSSEWINQTAAEAGLATSAQGTLADSALQPADLSVATNAAGTAALTYTSGTGVFSYTPPDLSSYLTSYTETDTLDSVTGRGATTTNAVTVGSFTSTGIDDNATSTAITINSGNDVSTARNITAGGNLVVGSDGSVTGTEGGQIDIRGDDGTTSQMYLDVAGSANRMFTVSNNVDFFIGQLAGTGGAIRLYTNGTERMRITSDGTVEFNSAIEEQQYNLTGTAIDPANGTIQYKTLGANTTFTESLADGEFVTLMIDDGAGYTITWPTTTWVGGSAPTLETSGYNIIELWHVNGTLYGAFVGAA